MPLVVNDVRCNNRKTNIVKHCYDRGVREYKIDGVIDNVRCNNRKTNIVKQLLLHPPPF